MELLNFINFEQLGVAGTLVALLLWQLYKKEQALKEEIKERKYWQNIAFTTTRDSQKEVFESAQIMEKVIERLKES